MDKLLRQFPDIKERLDTVRHKIMTTLDSSQPVDEATLKKDTEFEEAVLRDIRLAAEKMVHIEGEERLRSTSEQKTHRLRAKNENFFKQFEKHGPALFDLTVGEMDNFREWRKKEGKST